MKDVKKVLFEKAKYYNEKALKLAGDEHYCFMYSAMATSLEDVIQECGFWKEYVDGYESKGE